MMLHARASAATVETSRKCSRILCQFMGLRMAQAPTPKRPFMPTAAASKRIVCPVLSGPGGVTCFPRSPTCSPRETSSLAYGTYRGFRRACEGLQSRTRDFVEDWQKGSEQGSEEGSLRIDSHPLRIRFACLKPGDVVSICVADMVVWSFHSTLRESARALLSNAY